MESLSPSTDSLVMSQERLFAQIKRSHHIFAAQLYVTLIYLPAIAGLFFLIEPFISGEELLGSLTPMLPFILIMGVLAIKQIKETYSFFRSSRQYFDEIEHARDPSQITIGLTTYVGHLSKILSPPTLLATPPLTTLSERLDHIENHVKKGLLLALLEFIVSGMVVAGAITFVLMADPEILSHPMLYIILSGFFIVPGIRLYLFVKWRPFMKQWLLGFQEINAWGERLEQLFQQQIEGGRGS